MSSEKVLDYLTTVSNLNLWLNAVIHLMVLTAVLILIFAKENRVKRWVVDGVICLLFISIVSVAIVYGNPFHALTMGLLAVFAVIELWQGKNEFNIPKINLHTFIAFSSIIIGFWYPDFVKTTPIALLLVSPAGIVPCPTLLIVLGLLTLTYPRVNKTQYTITAIIGVFYGFTGVFQLKVFLDIALIIIVGYAIFCLIKTWAKWSNRGNKDVVR
jgi:hypothetical protein